MEATQRAMPAMTVQAEPEEIRSSRSVLWAVLVLLLFVGVGLAYAFANQ
jgi:hypothetical protein